ncbi:EF-hand domain-containing protein [Candidatus Uabimicrobium amorphum]|uniref:EF-hand domain-containing protein n=1 Tax=Uabimicrobium amorphum TaxID=2596890 RepID=A0A5S9IQY4_UABAM|nr:EF-hand domain-containing protein [Candidatus Uabimicrobium amorphum]BBM86449.1 hypothetical protein UABAM_04835 [Candidatus Uabimicrobium amorphum]
MQKLLFAMLLFCLSFPVFGDDETTSDTQAGDLDKIQKDGGKKNKRRAHIKKMREKFDADGNGELSKEERKRFKKALLRFEMKRKRKRLMKEMDTDGDGKLTAEQQQQLTEALEKHKENFLQRRNRKRDGENRNGNGRFQQGGENQQRFRQKMLERFDTNKDGILSEEEKKKIPRGNRNRGRFQGFRQKMLERFDTNKDGVLSEEEKQKMRETLGNQRGRRGRNR